MVKEDVVKIVFDSLDELNQINGTDIKKALDTPLFGIQSALDSLDFVSLIVSVEDKIHDQYGELISITSSKAMSLQNSPFKTISTLADYIMELLT